jgi:predicted phage-related endonuclease
LLKLEDFYYKWIRPNIDKPISQIVLPEVDGSDFTKNWIKRRYKEHTAETLEPTSRHYEIALRREQLDAQLKALNDEKALIDNKLRNEIGATGKAGFRDDLVTITWKETKGHLSTNWEAVAKDLQARSSLIKKHTSMVPGHRRLYCKLKKGAHERLRAGTLQQKLTNEEGENEQA